MNKPNIIYILTDDLGYGDLSCYHAQHYTTENIDRLAAEGRRYEDAHATSAVCTPSRYSVLTGRYCWRGKLKNGVLNGHDASLIEPGRTTVATYLRQHGYATACIGKWHLGMDWGKSADMPHGVDYSKAIQGGPLDHGFDYYFGISASLDMPPYCFIENNHTVGIPSTAKDPIDFSQNDRGGLMVLGWRDEDVNPMLTEKALAYIEKRSECGKDQPFFLYLPVTGPHTPWVPNSAFKGASGIGPRGDLILEIDDTVGRLLQLLEEKGMRENTLIVFTSDNGPDPASEEITVHGHEPAGELRGQKADIWEGGHRVPFIVSWPDRIPRNTVSSELLSLGDLLATCAGIVGAQLPDDAGEDSVNMLGEMCGQQLASSLRESIILQSIDGTLSLRQGDWKYIQGRGGGGFDLRGRKFIGIPHTLEREVQPEDPQEQLYHLGEDVGEHVNVCDDYPHRLAQMRRDLERLITAGRTRPTVCK